MSTSGSFGWFRQRYAIHADHVVVSRNVWVPFAMLALGVAGAVCLSRFFSTPKANGGLFVVGFVGVMAAVMALVKTPWLSPARITFSRAGIVWGSTSYPRHAIAAVRAMVNELRGAKGGRYQSWTIVVALTNGKPLTLSLGDHTRFASAEPVHALHRAMAAALG